jgi:hypothetical protein
VAFGNKSLCACHQVYFSQSFYYETINLLW